MYKPSLRKAVLLSFLAMAASAPAAAQTLERLLERASSARLYRQSSPAEMQHAQDLFLRVLRGERSALLQRAWRALGMNLEPLNDNGAELLVLYESDNMRMGRGLYAFRPALSQPIALQAPHSFKDYHTRQIVLEMMLETQAAAAAWNTTPRSFDQAGATINADLAHQEQTFFIAFSRAFAQHYARGRILQLHGFAQEKRATQAGAAADMILSSGRQTPTPAALAAGRCLKQRMPGSVRIYPHDVLELGGETNTIGHALTQMGHAGFLHLEISRSMRKRVRSDDALRQAIWQCAAALGS